MNNYLISAIKQFQYYKMLGEKSINQIDDEKLFHRNDDSQNSIAIIVNHLWGNMMSRWTDFLNSDGEKDFRNRDLEFESVINNKTELLQKWEEGWNCLFSALDEINDENFNQTIYIRNQGHSITEAVNRQLCHYAYHIGQIVLLAKQVRGADFDSLSIPKGKSKDYNSAKFSQEKKQAHFTDEFLTDKNEN